MWRLRAPSLEVAKMAMHTHINLKNRIEVIHRYDNGELIEMLYLRSPDDLNNMVNCDHRKFNADYIDEIMQSIKTIKRVKVLAEC